MAQMEYKCGCGCRFDKDPGAAAIIRCPDCGRVMAAASKEGDVSKAGDFDRMVEATFEIMAEGGVTFSGAR